MKSYFTHDPAQVIELSRMLTTRMHIIEQQLSHEPQDFDDFQDRVYRMVCASVAKKMANSLGVEENHAYGGALNRIGAMSVGIPTGLLTIIDGYGRIDTPELTWEMRGQAAWTLTYYLRACAPENVTFLGQAQVVPERTQAMFMNARLQHPARPLLALMSGTINAWASNAPQHNFVFGNVGVTMCVPTVTSGFVGYQQLIGPVPNKPAHVVFALAAAVVLETIEARPNGQPIAADIPLLNAQNVVVGSWDSHAMDELNGAYYGAVESRLIAAMEGGFGYTRLKGVKDHGAPWQLIHKGGNLGAHTPVQVAGGELDMGWMMAGQYVYYSQEPQTYLLQSQKTQMEAKVDFITSIMTKRGH